MTGDIVLLILVLAPMAAAPVGYIIGRRSKTGRDYFADGVTILEFMVVVGLLISVAGTGPLSLMVPDVCGMGISFEMDGFRGIFAGITAFMWMMTTVFSKEYLTHYRNRNRYYFFLLITYGAVMGVFLSDDLFTTFIFFEIMSMASYVCVVHEENDAAMNAGAVYLTVAVIGGMAALMGIFIIWHYTGTVQFETLLAACQAVNASDKMWLYIAGGCILAGFGAKAGMFPLHVWLPMAHPVAPAPASALLSGIITKTGIFGVIIVSTRIFFQDGYWGFVILMFGVATMLVGGVLAVFSVDLKRTLACSSMSQLGFIFVGIGMQGLLAEENALAVRGTLLHMFNHSNLKLVLFMVAGVVFMNLHKLDLNEIRGFGRKKPLIKYAFLMGSLGIAGIPLFNGYISKTLIHESIVEYTELLEAGGGAVTFAFATGSGAVVLFKVIEWLFIITGAMTVAYMTKLFVAIFVEKNNDPAVQASYDSNTHYCNKVTGAVVAISATVLPILGMFPYQTMNRIADLGEGFMLGGTLEEAVHYFSLSNLTGALYSIAIGALIYIVVIRCFIMKRSENGLKVYVNRWPKWMDLVELFYRPVVMEIIPTLATYFFRFLDFLVNLVRFVPKIGVFICRCFEYILDGIIVLARKTTHRQVNIVRKLPRYDVLGYILGCIFNAGAWVLNKTFRRKNPVTIDFRRRFSIREQLLSKVGDSVSASVSFSLMMFGIGIIIVVLYILLS